MAYSAGLSGVIGPAMLFAFEIYWAVSLWGAAFLAGGRSPKRTFPTKLTVPGPLGGRAAQPMLCRPLPRQFLCGSTPLRLPSPYARTGWTLGQLRTFPTKLTGPGSWVDVLLSPFSAGLSQGSSSVALTPWRLAKPFSEEGWTLGQPVGRYNLGSGPFVPEGPGGLRSGK
ncbi:hypothetical protein MRX96_018133 [Rhipicephalus microplus]